MLSGEGQVKEWHPLEGYNLLLKRTKDFFENILRFFNDNGAFKTKAAQY